MRPLTQSTGLAITNPLVLYRTLVATKRIEPDPAQHRLAIHLQKLYHRLKDYRPEVEFQHELRRLRALVEKGPKGEGSQPKQPEYVGERPRGFLSGWREKQDEAEVTAMTRRLNNHQVAAELDSPRGLLLYGEVGTGKSLLVDLLANSLPNEKKRRWHFNMFMLDIYARLEKMRRAYSWTAGANCLHPEEYSLLRLAREMISTSPILFIDEFQFSDRAASKILSNLLTSFFHLGGVLIATSNRMPEELANATGIEFTAPAPSRIGALAKGFRYFGNVEQRERSEDLFGGSDFAAFLAVLKARCERWEMEGLRDWRRRDDGSTVGEALAGSADSEGEPRAFGGLEAMKAGNLGLGYGQSLHNQSSAIRVTTKRPISRADSAPEFCIVRDSLGKSTAFDSDWNDRLSNALQLAGIQPSVEHAVEWKNQSIRVYGRNLHVPRQKDGVTQWTFDELCAVNFGPADYISLASAFHTFIVTNVPRLSLLRKNEARRFITLLDALYEARCKLLMSSEAGPDHIFFPESKQSRETDRESDRRHARQQDDEVYPETFSEIYQDRTSPFRPNVSSYSPSASAPAYATSSVPTSAPQLSAARSILADEDSDFGPVFGTGRRQSAAGEQAEWKAREQNLASRPDFSSTGAFTGQDEMFAYKRAQSRLWEMCGTRWWNREGDWWRPLRKDARHWEVTEVQDLQSQHPGSSLNKEMSPHGASPFRTSQAPPPVFSWTHAWGMITWGKKAGAWGKGPAGLTERKNSGQNSDDRGG